MTYTQDYTRIKQMADQGNVNADLILELIEKGRNLRTQISDISLALGMRSERDHDEILNGVIEDMLNELLPTILKATYSGMPGNFFDGLSFYLPVQMRLDVAIFTSYRHHGHWPTTMLLSARWKAAMQDAATYTYREGSDEHEVNLVYAEWANLERIEAIDEEETN